MARVEDRQQSSGQALLLSMTERIRVKMPSVFEGMRLAMFRLFLRARTQKLLHQFSEGKFKTRSSTRDAESDRARLASIMSAIQTALNAAEAEHSGLQKRLNDVMARASVSVGNDTYEHLDREPHRTSALDFFDREFARAETRLKELEPMIAHFKYLKTALLTRFPDFKPPIS
jgi:hypothetical protein